MQREQQQPLGIPRRDRHQSKEKEQLKKKERVQSVTRGGGACPRRLSGNLKQAGQGRAGRVGFWGVGSLSGPLQWAGLPHSAKLQGTFR